MNSQDNYNRTGDGFFSRVRPSLDAVEEVTVSTATPGAESGGQGAIQIKFVTRSGNNEYHGSLYEYMRNPVLNANDWFNNRDIVAPAGEDPLTWKSRFNNTSAIPLMPMPPMPTKCTGPMLRGSFMRSTPLCGHHPRKRMIQYSRRFV